VEAAFMSTLRGRGIGIADVHRVQNASMWQTYAVKRRTILMREAATDSLWLPTP